MRLRSTAGALAVGSAGALAVLAALLPFNDRLDLSVPALLLLVPVVAASVLGGWQASIPVAVLAAVGYAFGYVPPVGDIRPHVGRDAVTLLTFVAVGLIVGVIARRGNTTEHDARLLDERRIVLLRSVGHDLRNPLHTIQAVTSGLLAGSPTDDAGARSSLETVAAESRRIEGIVSNMLHVSRIQAGALMPALAAEHLPALVAATVLRLAPGLTQQVQVDVPPTLPDVRVDAVQFDQVLTNLIENAARYGKPDGTITVSAGELPPFAELTVADDGPGFGEAELVGAAPFRAGQASPGVGLGLVVCRGIVEAHGGRLTLANRRGGGAEVRFTIQLAG